MKEIMAMHNLFFMYFLIFSSLCINLLCKSTDREGKFIKNKTKAISIASLDLDS